MWLEKIPNFNLWLHTRVNTTKYMYTYTHTYMRTQAHSCDYWKTISFQSFETRLQWADLQFICSSGWPWIHNLPVSTSQVLRLESGPLHPPISIVFFFLRQSVCNSGWPQIPYEAKNDPGFLILLPPLVEYWGYRHAVLDPVLPAF